MEQRLSTAPMEYRPMGALRLGLATLVLISHSAGLLTPEITPLSLGNTGVLTFFALSGFVISEAIDRNYRSDAGRFLLNRALKLMPAYWAALVVALFAFALAGSPLSTDLMSVLGNIVLPLGYFPAFSGLAWISITWAIVVEIQFYLVAAAVAATAWRMADPRWIVAGALVAAIIGYCIVYATGAYARFYGALQFAPFFSFGVVLYLWRRRSASGWWLLPAALLSLHAFVSYVGRGDVSQPWATIIFAGAMLAFTYLSGRHWTDNRLRPTDQLAGDLSYPVYLIHMPAVVLAEQAGGGIIFVVSATLVASLAIHWVVERPIRKVRTLVRRRSLV